MIGEVGLLMVFWSRSQVQVHCGISHSPAKAGDWLLVSGVGSLRPQCCVHTPLWAVTADLTPPVWCAWSAQDRPLTVT